MVCVVAEVAEVVAVDVLAVADNVAVLDGSMDVAAVAAVVVVGIAGRRTSSRSQASAHRSRDRADNLSKPNRAWTCADWASSSWFTDSDDDGDDDDDDDGDDGDVAGKP